MSLQQQNKVTAFMKARIKNILVAGVSVCALFGITSAGILLFHPEELVKIKDAMTAQAQAGYKLPPVTAPSPTPGNDVAFLKSFSKVFSNIAKETRPALLLIVAEKKVAVAQPDFPDDFFFPFLPPQFGGPGGRGRRQGVETDAGSGFIVDLKNGYAITNNHVIDNADKITVTTYENRKYKAKIVGNAKNLDIAVLKLEDFTPSDQLKQLSLADSDRVDVGDWVVALGAPFELPQTVTMGVVGAVKRSGDVLGITGPNNFIQTDAAINPGNSGGPLVNLDGQVIGMNTAIYSKNGTSVGIGFAIPSNTIRLVADSLISHGKLMQAYLGIEMYPVGKFSPPTLKEMKIDPNTEGGLVMRVVPGSPAANAGLEPYDIIQSVNGVAVKSPADIQAQIMFMKPGTRVKLGVLRNGRSVDLIGTVEEAPARAELKARGPQAEDGGKSLSAEYGFMLEQKPRGKGVLVSRVKPGSLAELAGLQVGDSILEVNKTPISSPAEMEELLKKARKIKVNTIFLLILKGDGSQMAVALQLS